MVLGGFALRDACGHGTRAAAGGRGGGPACSGFPARRLLGSVVAVAAVRAARHARASRSPACGESLSSPICFGAARRSSLRAPRAPRAPCLTLPRGARPHFSTDRARDRSPPPPRAPALAASEQDMAHERPDRAAASSSGAGGALPGRDAALRTLCWRPHTAARRATLLACMRREHALCWAASARARCAVVRPPQSGARRRGAPRHPTHGAPNAAGRLGVRA